MLLKYSAWSDTLFAMASSKTQRRRRAPKEVRGARHNHKIHKEELDETPASIV